MSSSSSSNSLKEQVIIAELLYTNFMVHHNLSLTAEHLSPLCAKMFPDSTIAKIFTCSRTKSICILNGAIQPAFKS